MSYYERWFKVLVDATLRNNVATPAELESGQADPSQPPPAPPQESTESSPEPESSDAPARPSFRPQQRVRARNLHARGHTRLPRYTRGKLGTVVRDHGLFALQDTDTQGQRLGDRRQYVYTVQFSAQELWGDRAVAGDSVYVDLWEDYLEPV
jgi:nitrile hydratase